MNSRGVVRLLGHSFGTELPLVPTVDDTPIYVGNGTNSWDVRLYGSSSSAYISWDASANDLKFEDNVSLMFGSGATAGQGTAGDIEIRWDGTDLDILQSTANSSIKFGVDGAGIDVVMYGDTSGVSMTWDQSADALVFAGAPDITVASNTAAALEVKDGTAALLALDTRNSVKNVNGFTVSSPATTVASEAAAHENPSLKLANKTITYTGTTGTTSQFGGMLNVGVLTLTDASAMTLDSASAVHINALAAAGGMLTISNSYMISTSVSDCYLTNAGVWTDTACWGWGKDGVVDATTAAIGSVLDKLTPRAWKYREDVHGDDHGRERVGIMYDELPDELRAPGQESGVSAGLLSSFALAAIKMLRDENALLKSRLDRLELANA